MSELPEKDKMKSFRLLCAKATIEICPNTGSFETVIMQVLSCEGDKVVCSPDLAIEIIKRYNTYADLQAEISIMKTALEDATNAIEAREKQIADQQAEIKKLTSELEFAAARLDILTNWLENTYNGSPLDIELGREYAKAARDYITLATVEKMKEKNET